MLGSLHDAEDVVQEAILKAWRSLARFEGRASVQTWLYRIATNACLDELDRRPRRAERSSIRTRTSASPMPSRRSSTPPPAMRSARASSLHS